MSALDPSKDPLDLPPGAFIKRVDPSRPFVAMSNRKRWSKCALSAVLPQLKTLSGPAAEEGTAAHILAEWALNAQFNMGTRHPPVVKPPAGLDNFDYSDRGVAEWQAKALTYAQTYTSCAYELVRNAPGDTTCRVEHKIENVTIHGVRVYTVGDVVLWNPAAERLIVGDYKFGRSPVGVGTMDHPNEQCAGAAVLFAMQENIQPQQVGLFVYQPRTHAGEPWQVLGVMDYTWLVRESEKLDRELAAIKHAADALGYGKLVPAVPGDHCTYCPSARWCPAAANYGATALDVDNGVRAMVDLSPAEVMALWAQRSAFKQFEDDLRERVKMLHERSDPSVTVRRRAGNRIWANPSAVVEALMLVDRYDLLQPPSLEKAASALPEDDLAALLTRAPDVLTYVAVDGKQPDTACAAFANYLPDPVRR